jgi:hypothetical protein
MAVKVFVEDFKGQKIFGIYEVDPTGNKIKQYPELSFGGRKAADLLDNVKELEKFVHDWRSNGKKAKT